MNEQTVNQVVEQLTGNKALETARFEALLATPLKKTNENPYWTFYEFELPSGPFAGGELRLGKTPGQALLSLMARETSPLKESDLDLTRWGEVRGIDVNPRIPPEGTDAYSYTVNGVKVSFQFTHHSRQLRSLALEWGSKP